MLLVLGTHNRKKAIELVDLLAPWGFQCQSLADHPNAIEIDETGNTFAENARLKACEQGKHLGRWVLGEDSGLSVDALGGAPGVYSARFSGSGATDESNNRLLIEKLGALPLERRTAHYVSHVVLADPQGSIRGESTGTCDGRIRFEPAGSGGFGYDPYFEIVEYHRTFAELGNVVKSILSHRARAVRALIPQVLQCVRDGVWIE
ncbi:MAG: non-canonical purine NTP pyrophosphatase [Pirellulales bacterium]